MNWNRILMATFAIFIYNNVLSQEVAVPSSVEVKKSEEAIKFAETITTAELYEHVAKLASEEFEGRETGEKGQKLAAEYLRNDLIKSGLKPAVNDTGYYQSFTIKSKIWDIHRITSDGKEFSFMDDWYTFPFAVESADIKAEEIVFAGFGIEDVKYNDFAKVDLKDKVVVIRQGEPVDNEGISYITRSVSPSTWSTSSAKKLQNANDKGIKALLVVVENYAENVEKLDHYINMSVAQLAENFKDEQAPEGMAVIFISENMADELIGKKGGGYSKYISKIEKKGKPDSYTEKAFVSIRISQKVVEKVGENVLGVIEGTDLKDEYVVITAHYDHMGVQDGEIYYGADDDASGVAAIMEIGEAFAEAKKAGHSPRRSILIMPVSGEEKGLLGSEYYSEHPVIPLENIVTNLNIDMIGRIDAKHEEDTNYVYIIGSNFLSSELHEISEKSNATYSGLKLDYFYNNTTDPNKYYYRSDHYNFAKHNIPIIFYFNGTHPDYHKPTDTIEKIHFELLKKRAQLIFYTAWEIANRDQKPEVDMQP